MVRHARDPVMLIRNMTNGSMQLNQVNELEHTFGLVVSIIGATMAVPGLCLLALMAVGKRGVANRQSYVQFENTDAV